MPIKKTKNTKYVSGQVKFMYGNIQAPDKYDENSREMYGITFLFPKDSPEAERFKKVINEKWLEAGLNKKSHNPMLDGDEKAEEREAEGKSASFYKGMYYVKTSTLYPVAAFTKSRKIWQGEDSCLNGAIGHVSIELKAYENRGSTGITCYLKGIQILEEGNPTSNVESDFDFEETEEENQENTKVDQPNQEKTKEKSGMELTENDDDLPF